MKSLFLPKYEQKIVKISALTTQGRNPDIPKMMTSWINSEIVWLLYISDSRQNYLVFYVDRLGNITKEFPTIAHLLYM